MTLKLTRAQRDRLFRLEPVRIAGKGKCPVEPGHVYRLSSRLSLRVDEIRWPKGGGWSLGYTLIDRRDPVRIMRRTPPANDPSQSAPLPDTEENIKAAQESAYTSKPTSLSDGGEAVGYLDQRRIAMQARLNRGQQQAVNQARRETWELEQRIVRLKQEARLRSINISSELRVIERHIARAEKRLSEGRAA